MANTKLKEVQDQLPATTSTFELEFRGVAQSG